jgi:hypothetical protein
MSEGPQQFVSQIFWILLSGVVYRAGRGVSLSIFPFETFAYATYQLRTSW